MKKTIIPFILFLAFFNTAFPQMRTNIHPVSTKFSKTLFANPPQLVVPPFSVEEAAKLDDYDNKNGKLPKFARNTAINVKLSNSGIWTILPNGGRTWRIQISSKGALGLIPLFDSLYLPEGALLHVYMPGKEEILGAFTHENAPELRPFCTGIIHGETCVVEYYEPASQLGKGIVSINQLGYAYRWVNPVFKDIDSVESGSGSCEVNTACPEGDGWQDQVRSSVRVMIVNTDGSEGFCSGALINNVRADCTPYILSAEHCTEKGVDANAFLQWVFLFDFTSPTCDGTNGPTNFQMEGCTEIANSEDSGGVYGSDFLLLKLRSTPPDSFNVFYSGWDNTDNVPDSGVCIHHPEGDCTKISTYNSPAVSASWNGNVRDTHWQVIWDSTQSGHGVTEPGSSGSPLYNHQKLIVGHLTGGSSCCLSDCDQGNSPNGPDLFGKIYFDWMLNGVIPFVQLQPWLDPDNTGASVLQGMNPPCGGSLRNDAGIKAIEEPDGNICSQTFTPCVILRNFGVNTLTRVTLVYVIDNNPPETHLWTGSLIPGGTTEVCLSSVTAALGPHTFAISAVQPNDSANSNPSNSMITDFYISPPSSGLILNLTTDNAGSQVTWQLTDSGDNVVASGGPYANYIGGEQFAPIPICVQPGCYTFTIFDASGNGMTDGEDGYFQITGPNGTPVYASLTNPAFGAEDAFNFCTPVTGIEEIGVSYLSVIPNPSTGVFNVEFAGNGQKTLQVYDVLGQLIMQEKSDAQNVRLDLSSLSKGVYILKTEAPDGKNTRKLVVD